MFEPFCGLSRHPFEPHVDAAFFFPSRAHEHALAGLRQGLRRRAGLTVLTGEAGAGKTTVLEVFLRQLDDEDVIACTLDCRQVAARGLLPATAHAFGVDHGALRQLSAGGTRLLLILDDAQTIAPESLAELPLLRGSVELFLAGEPELRARVAAGLQLEPLDPDETRDYIEHRMRRAGWKGASRFDAEAIALIHARTGGIPGRINALCARVLTGVFVGEGPLGVEALKRVIQAA